MRSGSARGGRGRSTAGTTGTAATETGGTRGTTENARITGGPLTGQKRHSAFIFHDKKLNEKIFHRYRERRRAYSRERY